MTVIEHTAWRCPTCNWTAAYREPMEVVYCVRCYHEGRGENHVCEEFVPAEQLRGAVGTALRDLASEAREICARAGVDDVAGWIGKTVLARVGGQ
jgi:hypothetical protein